MSTYTVTLAVTTDLHLDDDQVRDAAARWAALMATAPGSAGFDLGMTSTSVDEPWLRVSGLLHADGARPDVELASALLTNLLAQLGATVTEWEAIEVWSAAEVLRRGRRPAIPPMVNAKQLAELAGLTSVQRIYQLESERAAGKRDDFPTPVLEGYWLRSMAEQWAANRKTKPGPVAAKPRTIDEAVAANQRATQRLAEEQRER